MAKLTDSEVNVSAIRRVDPLVKDLVDSATHAAFYTFNTPKNEWEKSNIEGALFVYSRLEEPFYSMCILNRNTPENLLEPIVKDLDLQSQYPFLLYKTKKGMIYGIWFYSKEDCQRISELIMKLVKQPVQPRVNKINIKEEKSSDNRLILNMLSKAQEEYNSTKSPMRNEKTKELESAPQSVMDFFAKAGVGVTQSGTDNSVSQTTPTGYVNPVIPILQRPVVGPAYVIPSTVPEVNHPIIQKIMSNPVHSVEHIEKQQRSTTPGTSTGSKVNDAADLDNSMLFMRISDSPTTNNIIPSQQFFNSNLISSQPIESIHNGIELIEGGKSALMPPTMFTSSANKDSGEILLNGILSGAATAAANEVTTSSSTSKIIEPLTKNQIVQAVSYLLKNDADFINKLHEAYLNSFKDIVST